jgi:hypothetical protein
MTLFLGRVYPGKYFQAQINLAFRGNLEYKGLCGD